MANELGISLEECYRGTYADLERNKHLVRFGNRLYEDYTADESGSSTTQLTGQSDNRYCEDEITVDWLLDRYNLALAQTVLYGATEMRIRVWDHFGTIFSYVKLFGLMHRIYPIDAEGKRVASTDYAEMYEAVLDGPASLFSQTCKYGIRLANFLPALALCDCLEMEATIADDEATSRTRSLALDHTDPLNSHYSAGEEFDSDIEQTLAEK